MTERDDSAPYGETFDHISAADMHETDEESIVTLSDGARVPKWALEEYLAGLDYGEHDKKLDKIDALVISSVATMSAVALALAVRRLKKNH